MESAESNRARNLGDYVALFRRQWLVLAVAVALGAAIGVGLVAVLPKTYVASSSVLVKATTDPGETAEATDARTTGEINMDTESEVVTSLPVATAVKEQTGSALTPVELSERVSVSIPPNTTIITIDFEADTAEDAQRGAAAFADAYLDHRASVAQGRVDEQIDQLNREAADTDKQIHSLLKRLPDLAAGSSARLRAEQELRRLRGRANWIDDQLLPLQTAQTAPGTVIVDAQRPSSPAEPNRVLVLGSAVALLLLVGLVVAWSRDRRQGRIRAAREVETDLAVEVLGTVRDSRPNGTKDRLSPIGYRRPSQEYRQVVHAIQARMSGEERAILVTGVGRESIAQQVAHTLGTAVARTGTDVTLVYSDDRSAKRYSPDAEVGARSGRGRRASLETTSLESSDLLVDGDVQNRALPEYLDDLGESGDRLILLSTPPTERSADAQAVAPCVRLTVLVVELNRSTQQDVAAALRQLHQVGVDDVVAVVVATRKPRRLVRGRPRVEEGTGRDDDGSGDVSRLDSDGASGSRAKSRDPRTLDSPAAPDAESGSNLSNIRGST